MRKHSKQTESMHRETIGIDLGKIVFHLVGLNRSGEVVVRKSHGERPG